MMNIAYRNFPTQYADTLRNKGQRQKARAFWEYHYDMEVGEHNAVRFYKESWGVSIGTTHAWINDFKEQIDIYHDAWWLRNQQHYSHAKKLPERTEQNELNELNTYKSQNIGICVDTPERTEQSDLNEALNLNNNNACEAQNYWNDPKFNDLFFIYGMNTKFKGRKEEAFEEFRKIDVDIDLLKLAAVQYLNDHDVGNKRYNLTNFLKNEIYLAYMPKRMEIMIEGEWLVGLYDDKSRLFTADNGFAGTLSAARLVELYSKDELKFINQVAKVQS